MSSSQVSEELAREKTKRLESAFASQRAKHWFDEDLFLGLMRLRGAEAGRQRVRRGVLRSEADAGPRRLGVRILVTGHHGYIGSVLTPILREAGHDVTGLDTFLYRGCDFGASDEFLPALEIDVRDVTPVDLQSFEAIVHLAALSNDPLGDLNADWTYAINRDGTVALARAAKEAGVRRFVFASSCSMYGAAEGDVMLDESAALRPLTPYAESKVAAEQALGELAGGGFSPVAMRNATVYGASPRLRLDIVLNNLVAWAHTTGAIRLQSDGTSWRPLVHVRDVARATLTLLEAPEEVVAGRGLQHRFRRTELPNP